MGQECKDKGLCCGRPRRAFESYRSQLREKLPQTHQDDDNFMDDISRAACCVSEMQGSELDERELCDLPYYLLGSMIYEKIKDKSKFRTTMNGVTGALKEYFGKLECTIEQSKSGIKLFAKMKDLGMDPLQPENIREEQEEQEDSSTVSFDRYKKYLYEIADKYATVEGLCTAQTKTDDCEGVSEEYKEKTPQKLYEAMYGKVQLQRPEVLSTDDCQEEEKLPSEKVYCELNQANDKCNGAGGTDAGEVSKELKTIVKKYVMSMEYEDRVVQAYCYAPTMKADIVPKEEDRCKFLYYWIGHTLFFTSNKKDQFSTAMKSVYDELGKLKGGGINHPCNILYDGNDNINLDIFTKMKTIFDYYHDYTTIKKCVDDPQAPDPKCTTEYASYLGRVVSAYKDMNAECKGENKNGWCTDFKSMTDERTYEELLHLKCSLKYTSECTNITAAILGTLTSISLPAAALLLYKYTSLFNGISNTLFGGGGGSSNRRKARSIIHHKLNTSLSEDDRSTLDDSTYDSTDVSTMEYLPSIMVVDHQDDHHHPNDKVIIANKDNKNNSNLDNDKK
ncbi:KIR protein [Plasmodium coatneyi]|uniref:KIR protein n=1 Tax=Plasmodium coatneyi TaxID=208452 RepID=A0A1B1DW56_9APIC|nr:KIR protein [Plasmodium coatneyi]ANQ06879.1 KIR protein [Plasmodium coatneyi]